MNRAVIEQWVEALESGEYPQTIGKLNRTGDEPGAPKGFCCLGVLCELALKQGVTEVAGTTDGCVEYGPYLDDCELPPEVRDWAGFADFSPEIGGKSLIALNDSEGWNFREIAELIRTEILEAP